MNADSQRPALLAAAAAHLDSGDFATTLAKRVAWKTESQNPAAMPLLRGYLTDEIAPVLTALGFDCQVHDNPLQHTLAGAGPLLLARRFESAQQPTVLAYGHGDVVRGQDASWRRGQGPWQLAADGQRLYGRGTADNKGQHSINIAALQTVLAARHSQGQPLGFNLIWLLEMSEETGSPGLAEFCAAHRTELAADLLLASDGPRYQSDRPTVFLGSRGVANFTLSLNLRDGAHHSGNWGGLLRNPGVMVASAIACLVDGQGVMQVPALRPPPISSAVRAALAGLTFGGDAGDPAIDPGWGEPGLSPAERVIAWNTLEVLAMRTGNPDFPVNAIPPSAVAHMHMRFVPGTDIAHLATHVQAHLAAHGLGAVQVTPGEMMPATRLDPAHPWVRWCLQSIARSTDSAPVLLPNLGGSLPNEVFADILGLPTVWVPHSYAGCCQHAPDEHLLAPVARQALQIMAGLYWDLGEPGIPARQPTAAAQ